MRGIYSSPRRARKTPASLFLRRMPPEKPTLGKPFGVSMVITSPESATGASLASGAMSCGATTGKDMVCGGGDEMDRDCEAVEFERREERVRLGGGGWA